MCLLLGATLLFTFGKHLTRRISARVSHDASTKALVGASIFELLVAIYGGYFGGGIGILMLATLALYGLTDIFLMNGLKIAVPRGSLFGNPPPRRKESQSWHWRRRLCCCPGFRRRWWKPSSWWKPPSWFPTG